MEMMGTTICAVRRNGKIAVAGDGQITMGQSVILKGTAKKVKRIYDDKVVIGFAGSVSDAISLSEKFEKMLQKYSGNLMRSAVELTELWRDDKLPRKLEAMMIVADKNNLLIVSGSGEVLGVTQSSPIGQEAAAVLVSLGLSRTDAVKAVNAVIAGGKAKTLEEVITLALRSVDK